MGIFLKEFIVGCRCNKGKVNKKEAVSFISRLLFTFDLCASKNYIMTRKFILLNIVAVLIFLFMLIDVFWIERNEEHYGWQYYALFIAACFSSLLVVADNFIVAKIKNNFKLFLVELIVLIIAVSLGFVILNS